jgi:cytochrome c-type biogenesis protein CcmH
MLGTPEMVEFDAAKHAAQSAKKPDQMPSVDEMLVALKKRLQQKPDDAQGWFLLGRTYMAMEQYPQAAEAYEALLKLTGDEPTVLLSLAEAATFANEGDMAGRPAEMIRKALKMSPDNQSALWMAGLLESQQENYSQAIAHWEKLETLVQDDSEVLKRVRAMISMVKEKASSPAADKK